MKTLEDLRNLLQKSESIEEAIAIRIKMIELRRKFKSDNDSGTPISDLLERIYQGKKLSIGF